MLDHKVSPLLDAMEVGECFAQHDGAACYRILHPESGREFVLKHISVPAGEEQVEALLLTGAYASQEEADAYYRKEAEALVREAENRKKLLDCPYILPFLGVQMEKKAGVGYDVYAVLPKRNSLEGYLNENAVSHLRGINMGIDLCVALAALREEGYVHGNLKPGNVFFSDTGRFLLGDFGLISTEDMQYAVLPEQYRSSYSAPELSGFLGLNETVDIYSLGMILYRIYNGNHAPFEDEKTGARAAEARRLAGEALPAPIYADYELAEIILKACAFEPAERYQSPEEMRVELEQYMRRNAVSDHLIVPPLVNDEGPVSAEAAAEETEPVRFADPEKMDEQFKKSFKPEEPKEGKKKKRRDDDEPLPISESPILSDEPPQLAADRRRLAAKLKKARQRRKRAWIAFAAAMVLLVTLIGLYEFTDLGKGLWHYFVKVDKLTVSQITADSLRVDLAADAANPDDFIALCQDAYGNSKSGHFVGGTAFFQDLNPNTQYNIKLELPGLHKLSGATSASAVTKPLTELLTFEATPGSEGGSVRLELVVKDEATEPETWTLAYGKTGETPQQTRFSGHSVQLSGLEAGVEYSFTLLPGEDLYLSGKTETVFTPLPTVEASELRLEKIENGEALLRWNCGRELPESWSLRCTDPEGKELPAEIQPPVSGETGWLCGAVIPNIVPDTSYSVTLSAPGLAVPLSLELRDDVITVTGFAAEATADGLSLRWAANREPAAGWRVLASFGDGQQIEELVQGDQCLMAVLPDTDYSLTLEAADGSSVTGSNTASIRSQYDRRFVQMGLDRGTTLGTYYTPDKEEWSFSDLGGGTIRYRHSDRITFVVTAGGSPVDSGEPVTALYVIQKADGETVNVQSEKLIWNEMWNNGRWYGQIPWLPEEPGSYSFSVYVNSQRMGSIPFTLVGE